MFEIGDKVEYGVLGTCEITDIGKPDIKGVEGTFYFLKPLYDDRGVIYSPIKNRVPMRYIMSRDEAEEFLIRAAGCAKDDELNKRISPKDYEKIVKSQDPKEILHLIRHLYNIRNERARQVRRMKSADAKILAEARKILYQELAAADGKDLDDVSDTMDAYLGIGI
ncbi:MAG: CarD family transcriptional regulator [Lachnospiraceae bacterium]|jgi:RNA polymerase-interacting CarD/CdnL/TRCF family regulator